ncbi:cytidine deaminase [Candidatus Woesearchaeota archaeon]|nr:cytidine deaminase [Candidatus Woesearchaeota archaeon]
MANLINQELIKRAVSVINPKNLKNGLVADVGCALLSGNDKIYTGVCVGVNSNGYCAERVAIAKMITDGKEFVIKKIVTVWKDETGAVFAIPPCGHCRECIRETDEKNINTEVILDKNKTVRLRKLLPYFNWWKKQKYSPKAL